MASDGVWRERSGLASSAPAAVRPRPFSTRDNRSRGGGEAAGGGSGWEVRGGEAAGGGGEGAASPEHRTETAHLGCGSGRSPAF